MVFTDASKQKLREANLGKHLSEVTKQKISASKKGTRCWNKGLKMPESVRLKQREAKLKNPTRYWLGNPRIELAAKLKGKPITEASILKRTIARFGNHWWYGCVRYEEDSLYCERFDEDFKERVRAYWGYQCIECGTPQTKRRLSIHHVHYDKKMCCNGSPRDVVPLCLSCHNSTNGKRDYWEKHFTEMLYSYHPEGKCYFTQIEMKQYKGVGV